MDDLERVDYLFALQDSLIVNTAAFVKHKKQYKPDDFMPKRRQKQTVMNWDRAKEQFRALDAVMKGK